MKISTVLFGVWLALLTVAVLRCPAGSKSPAAEPVRKPTLWLALDDQAASRMLRSELARDWLRANPAIVLTRRQRDELTVTGRRMNMLQSRIRAEFVIVFVESDAVPLPQRLHLPAACINHGRWESLDQRAFIFETRPLLTLDWYRSRYAALFDRDAALDALATYGCSDEGYSGAAQIETPAPWERDRNDECRMTNDEGSTKHE